MTQYIVVSLPGLPPHMDFLTKMRLRRALFCCNCDKVAVDIFPKLD